MSGDEKVVSLVERQDARARCSEQTIAALERLLERAKNGNIIAVAAVYAWREPDGASRTAIVEYEPGQSVYLLGLVSRLHFRCNVRCDMDSTANGEVPP